MNKVIAFLRLVTLDDKNRWYCGYVGVKDDSMLPHTLMSDIDMFDKYPETLDAKISVHGGITYDGKFRDRDSIIPLTEIPEDWYKYHCYGFDLNHIGDDNITMNFYYAKQEALNMKKQMEELIAELSPSTGD